MSYKPHQSYKRLKRPKKRSSGYMALSVKQCGQRVEGDEMTCHCGLRWSKYDPRPECSLKRKPAK